MPASESCLENSRSNTRETGGFNRLLGAVSRFYCRLFHRSISRPVNSKYQCWKCLEEFEIRW